MTISIQKHPSYIDPLPRADRMVTITANDGEIVRDVIALNNPTESDIEEARRRLSEKWKA